MPAWTPRTSSASRATQHPGGGERSRVHVLDRDRSAPDRQRGVALELVDPPVVVVDHVDDHVEEAVHSPTTSSGGFSSARAVEPMMSTKRTATGRASPAELHALVQSRPGHVRADVPAEEVAQLLPLVQAAHHLVEPGLQHSDLGAVVDPDLHVEVSSLHLGERLPQAADRLAARLGRDVRRHEADHDREAAEDDRGRRQVQGVDAGPGRRSGPPRPPGCRAG